MRQQAINEIFQHLNFEYIGAIAPCASLVV